MVALQFSAVKMEMRLFDLPIRQYYISHDVYEILYASS